MSSWDFRKEKNQNNAGSTTTNPTGGLKAGFQPNSQADLLSSKRNVIATAKGWVRRTIKQTGGVGSTPRIVDEVLVAAHPGTGDGFSYASNNHLGNPDIAQIYLDSNSITAAYSGSTAVKIYVVYNEPVKHSGLSGNNRILIANTAGGNSTVIAIAAPSNSNTGIVNANNTLVFSFTPTAGDAGTYKIQAQTIANNIGSVVANVVSLNAGWQAANLVITGAVSNTVGTITITAA